MGLLKKAEIPVPTFRIATNMEEASKAADEIGLLFFACDFLFSQALKESRSRCQSAGSCRWSWEGCLG